MEEDIGLSVRVTPDFALPDFLLQSVEELWPEFCATMAVARSSSHLMNMKIQSSGDWVAIS